MQDEYGVILVVCAEAAMAQDLLAKLEDEGFATLGPAATAGVALTLAAQTAVQVAIVAGETTGRRSAAELAEELSATWGVKCFLLDREPKPDEVAGSGLRSLFGPAPAAQVH